MYASILYLIFKIYYDKLSKSRRCGGMADAADSKSADSNIVWVQVPPPAPNQYNPNLFPIGDGFGLLLSLTTTKVPTSAAGCGASPPPSREAPEEESSPINAKRHE